jgi:hypothetical protein
MRPPRDARYPLLTMRTVSAAPLRTGSTTITPVIRSLVAGWRDFALVWSRPQAVLVGRDGRTSRFRIFNLTRAVQLSIVAAAVLGAFWISTRSSSQKEMSQ